MKELIKSVADKILTVNVMISVFIVIWTIVITIALWETFTDNSIVDIIYNKFEKRNKDG